MSSDRSSGVVVMRDGCSGVQTGNRDALVTPTGFGNAGRAMHGAPARTARRTVLVALLCAALASPALACGPDFPVTLLDRRELVMGGLPEGVFDFEVARLLVKPADTLAVVEWDSWEDTEPLRAQAESAGLDADAAASIAAMRAAGNVDEALGLAGSLPRDVALYTAGALAWNQQDFATALEYFQAVSALPAGERPHRGLWASFMEGRTQALNGDSAAAVEAFERTRALARAGASDPLGLAVASLGEQARVQRGTGDAAAAVRLYAEQAARGSASGRNSLLFVARNAMADPAAVDSLLQDELGTRLLLAYLYSRYNELIEPDPENEYPSYDAPADGPRLIGLLDRVAAAPNIPDPDRLAAIAYRAGRFEQAGKLVAGVETPLAAWLRAKLALRDGQLDVAAAAYAQAAKGFPAEEVWGEVPMGGESYEREQLQPRCRVQAEAGTLALSRGDYLQALELLYAAADVYWADAAYIAERVVTLDELKTFVDRVAGSAPKPVAPAADAVDEESEYLPPNPGTQIRALLARRLMREGRLDVALAYFDDPETHEHAQGYVAARKATSSWTRVGQARAWFDAAQVARWHGMQIMGYEGDPDYFIWGGDFDLNSPITWDEDYNPIFNARSDLKIEGPWTSAGERERVAASRAQPLERFHYRLVAAAHAGQAADVLPPRSQAFAAVLCEGTRWLIDRQPEDAQKLYKRYLREGPYVPWGASFGRECPAPDFAKVEGEIRAQWMHKAGRVAIFAVPIALLLGVGLWWRRRRSAAT